MAKYLERALQETDQDVTVSPGTSFNNLVHGRRGKGEYTVGERRDVQAPTRTRHGCRADAAKLAVTRCDAEEQQEIIEIQYVLVSLFTKFLGA